MPVNIDPIPIVKENAGVIILGAKEFPHSKFTSSPAFFQAYKAIKDYFRKNIFQQKGSTCKNVLDLFNTALGPDKIDLKITKFIEKNPHLKDIVFYYVGHGGFDNQSGFLLAIKGSRTNNLGISSISARMLGKTLNNIAQGRRLFIILDCCFAAQLYTSFQSPLQDLVEKEISDNFPPNGIALLCASSREKPAVLLNDETNTMFTDALNNVLRNGCPSVKNKFLSLREVGDLTFSYIKGKHRGDAVKPEVHTLKMPGTDIADIPSFVNMAYDSLEAPGKRQPLKAYDIAKKFEELLTCARETDLNAASKLLIDFVESYKDEQDKEAKEKQDKYTIEEPLLNARCKLLEEHRPPEDDPKYSEYCEKKIELLRQILTMAKEILEYWKKKLN